MRQKNTCPMVLMRIPRIQNALGNDAFDIDTRLDFLVTYKMSVKGYYRNTCLDQCKAFVVSNNNRACNMDNNNLYMSSIGKKTGFNIGEFEDAPLPY